MPEDQTLGGNPDAAPAVPDIRPSLSTAAVETVLDLSEVMSQARLVEKKARICLRGDLQAEFDEVLEELSGLVDEHGETLNDDEGSLSDASRAHELNDRLTELKAEMSAAMRVIRFRAMPDDEWQSWNKTQRDAQGDFKDPDRSNTEAIARCAIEPKMTVSDVEQLRKTLGPTQIATLANAAFSACTTGGLDIPKLPHFSPSQRRDSSGRN